MRILLDLNWGRHLPTRGNIVIDGVRMGGRVVRYRPVVLLSSSHSVLRGILVVFRLPLKVFVISDPRVPPVCRIKKRVNRKVKDNTRLKVWTKRSKQYATEV